ncbi:DUF423 domain-containing protein [Marinicella gelatinilytica]|uniref:DUF423 domain-containing protein n=1 Tax=Marinicella gelatinilytica TaxID=2996017 RepID=UPI0022609CBF|nr:DUF423 domain-containing protein [Marinicella gelatinilytica]MCX7544852.1 DUF423 domain-containing protein [Marinicella gelatinilytica]
MTKITSRYIILAAFYGLTAVVFGALGQHALGLNSGSNSYALFQHAFIYQLIHALLLIWVATQLHHGFWLRAAALAISLGILLFCGGLYLLIFVGKTWFSWITPFGGSLLILGWLNVVIHGFRQLFKPE